MIDYKGIIENLETEKVKQLLYELGAEEVIEKEDCLITNTICHNVEGGSLKLYYYFDTHIFYCYSNCDGMSIFTFLKHYYETRDIDYNWYEDIYEVVCKCSLNKPLEFTNKPKTKLLREKYERIKIPTLPIYPANVMDIFSNYHAVEWLQDGISDEAMTKYNIKYSISQNKIIIPHYDVNNNLIGIRGRALNEWEIENLGKYMPVQIEQTWYKHPLSLNLYGLNLNKENIKKYRRVYLFEAEKSVLQFESFNLPNCAVAVCGSNFNKYQLKLLMKECHPQEIIICFDNEEVGNSDKYFMKLWKICQKYKNYANFSFIYDKKHLSKLKDSPSDNGEEIFKQLLNDRVRVK